MSISSIREHVLLFLHAVRSCQSKVIASATFIQKNYFCHFVKSLNVTLKIERSKILYIYEIFERHIFLIIKWDYS